MNPNSQPKKSIENEKIIIVMRHGEREDDDLKSYNKYDPNLTSKGMLQSKFIGQELKKILEDLIKREIYKIKISIVCSPFLRTIVTANKLLEGLIEEDYGLKNLVKSLEINFNLYEYLNIKSFDSHPNNHLEINKMKSAESNENVVNNNLNFLSLIPKVNIINDKMPNYPENFNDCVSRYDEALQSLKQSFLDSENEVMVLITHGYGVQIMATNLNIEDDCFYVDYCSTYVFKIINGSSKFITSLNSN